MKQFLSFVYKEFCHILRDSRTVLILLVMPIVQIILFGFAISTDVNNVRLAVYDPSNDDATRRIVERFDANRYFSLVETLRTPQQIEEAFRSNRADLALVFEENFQQNLLHGGTGNVQLICDGTDPNTATLVTSYASNILAAYQAELSAGTPAPLQIVPEVKLLYNPQMKGAYNFVPGVMGMILMLICAMMTAISIVREKERGTMEVLLVSPVRPLKVVLAKMIPYFALSYFNLASILLLARFVLDVPLSGNLGAIIGVSMLYLALSLAFGLLISTFADRQATALIISGMLILLPIIMFSGLAFPIENMPKVLQPISCIIPTRWYIDAVRKLMIEGLPFGGVLREFSILAAMTALLIAAALRKFNDKLE